MYIFISASFQLSLYSWIAGLDDDEQWSELFVMRVQALLKGGIHLCDPGD